MILIIIIIITIIIIINLPGILNDIKEQVTSFLDYKYNTVFLCELTILRTLNRQQIVIL